MKKLSIIGGGPAALMLAAEIDTEKYQVTLYDQKKSVGRKFLVAGDGGLNLTFNSPLEEFISKYVPREFMDPIIRKFTNQDWINWLHVHEIPTFVGSSNRVFPEKGLKPVKVLNKIKEYISANGVGFQLDTKWTGWNEEGHLCFEGLEDVKSDIVVIAMGGASKKVTGSDGLWVEAFKERGVRVEPFRAANCAFGVDWNNSFINTYEGTPLKNIALTFNKHVSKGELVISKFGLEGNAIYALSQKIQEKLLKEETTLIHLDLKPMLLIQQIQDKLKSSKRAKISHILKENLSLDRCSIALLKQFSDKESFLDMDLLAKTIKSLPITLHSAEELDKAISSLGGVSLDEINGNFQYKKIPNTYAIGEMLDWWGPTGGYLLQGSFSMGFVLAKHLNALEENE
ncbi:TIGR03862 family flavoprotein [Methanococcoides sp. SA1]|uniref:NAD(P)/FAD-dependent oxidoreductase n=1 Tax=unclassified Lentimicrobium TaxID=2677434 RepID=UPI0015564936|nr:MULTISPECIES: TIGR03862 family flavoprotein [unclassified Lentimicrobium]NPD47172.1 TIGR03862 family flavoprotein [Lentimicrobium sp. S6]NPD84819.1 TIGR03862 family flavoprotein [Lentimicrobium sp. L6]NPE28829.1 TIGR03862 family flavoprotein [Methanococcoides sp. SA1]